MKMNLEQMFLAVKKMTEGTKITRQQQITLAKEMMEYFQTQMIVCDNNEKQAKDMTLIVMMNLIEEMKIQQEFMIQETVVSLETIFDTIVQQKRAMQIPMNNQELKLAKTLLKSYQARKNKVQPELILSEMVQSELKKVQQVSQD